MEAGAMGVLAVGIGILFGMMIYSMCFGGWMESREVLRLTKEIIRLKHELSKYI